MKIFFEFLIELDTSDMFKQNGCESDLRVKNNFSVSNMSTMIGEAVMTRLTGLFDEHKLFEALNGYQHAALLRFCLYI